MSGISIDPNQAQRVRQELNLQNTINSIKHTIAIQSGKGGVGKSTITLNLAIAFVEQGYKVGIMDADITGPSIPILAGLAGQDILVRDNKIIPNEVQGVKIVSMDLLLKYDTPVVWRGPLKMAAIRQFLADVNWGELDFLFIDLPPGTSDEPLTIAQIFKNISGTVIVTTPQLVAVHDVKKSIGFASKVGMRILGIIENMSGLNCPNCNHHLEIFSKGGGKKAAEELGLVFLGAIPLLPNVVKEGDDGKPSYSIQGEFRDSFSLITEKISKLLQLK
ncbi:MAG: Mrp/NBP35 family ATP-binding protein [Candidatus Heimdallarchaeota archaeon]|nr:Mrp/NBP35 family ATP-binding protein [Candidatus Heimdallarchaeota archaeon]